MSASSAEALSLVVVVPARGGSTRVPGKNIRELAGRPLLAHTLAAVREAGLGVPVVVSTDDDAIAVVAEADGARVVRRPAELSTDTASTEAALLHVLDILAGEGGAADWVMTLPPTSPFRDGGVIRAALDAVRRDPDDQDCLMTVTEDRGDYWRMDDGGVLTRLVPGAPRRQQERAPLYLENSAIYLSRVAALRETGSVLGRRVRGLAIDPQRGFDINDESDFDLAEAMARAMPHLVPGARADATVA